MTENDLAKMSGEEKVRVLGELLGLDLCGRHNPLTDANARDDVVEAMRERHGIFVHLYQLPHDVYQHWWVRLSTKKRDNLQLLVADSPGEALVNACLLAVGE